MNNGLNEYTIHCYEPFRTNDRVNSNCVAVMADSFNPQEILARLRAKPAASAPPPPLASPNGSFMLSGGSSRLAGSKQQLSSAPKNAPPPTSINQELAEANPRQELEKEITRLQGENASFRKENKQLRIEKEELERNFVEFKSKAEDTIAKLRGKLATLAFDSHPPAKVDLKVAGKLYRNNPIIPEPKLSTPTSRQGRSPERHLSPPDSGGFRDPTFSELMRRSTDEPLDFRESLRKPRNIKLNKAAPMQPHGSGGSQMLGSPSSEMMMSPPQPPALTITTVAVPNANNASSNSNSNNNNGMQQMQQQATVESKQVSSSHHLHHRNSSRSLGGLGENMYPSFLSYGGYPGSSAPNDGGFVEYERSSNNAFVAEERRNTLRRASSNASITGGNGQAPQMGSNNMSSANMTPFEGGEYSHAYRPNELPVLEVDLTR